MKNPLSLFIIIVVLIFVSISSLDAITYSTLDYPGSDATWLKAIDGSNIVGWYHSTLLGGGYFLYNGTTWTTLDLLSGEISGISGSYIVGRYSGIVSFLYDWTAHTTLYFSDVSINGIDGSKIVGSANGHGFIYNLETQMTATFDFPGAVSTSIVDIDGDNIIGQYWDASNNYYNFFCDGTTYVTLNLPGAVNGISGRYIISRSSFYSNVYNLDTQDWTVLAFPDAYITIAENIDGDSIVGVYGYGKHGFIATIPEPATVSMFVMAGAAMMVKRKKKA